VTFDAGKNMIVVKCGASGHNIRSKPNLKGIPIGMLALGNTVIVQEYVS
jgi:E3 ubiquitin-protein ligase MYCBP2